MSRLNEIFLYLRQHHFLEEIDLAGIGIGTATDGELYALIKRMKDSGAVVFKLHETMTRHQQEIAVLQMGVDARLRVLEEKRREVAVLENELRAYGDASLKASVNTKALWAGGVALCATGLLMLSKKSSGIAAVSRQLLTEASTSASARRIVESTARVNAAFFLPSTLSRITSSASGVVSAVSSVMTTWWTRQSMQQTKIRNLLASRRIELIALEHTASAWVGHAELLRQKKEILTSAVKAYAFMFPHLQGFSVVRFLSEDSLRCAISFVYSALINDAARELRTFNEISLAAHVNIIVHCITGEVQRFFCEDRLAPEIHLQYDGAHYHALIPELSLVWQGKYRHPARAQSDYRNKPDRSGIVAGGSAIKVLCEKVKTKPGSIGAGKDWMAKYAGGDSGMSPSTAAMEPGSRLRIRDTRDAISEVIAAGFYRVFSENDFDVLKIRLARLYIYSPYHADGVAVLAEERLAGLGAGREQGVHSLCKIISNYHNLTELTECITSEGMRTFQECLANHILPEAAQRHGKVVSLLSLVKVLMLGKAFGDIDVYGGGGGNAGFQDLFDETGQFVGIKIQKIDPGFAFAFRSAYAVFHMDEAARGRPDPDERDIQFGSGSYDHLIYWQLLTEKQRYLYLQTFEMIVATVQQEGFLDYMLHRDGVFNEPQAGTHAWTSEKIQRLKEDIRKNIRHLQRVYARDLAEENYLRHKRTGSGTSLSQVTQFFIPHLNCRSVALDDAVDLIRRLPMPAYL